MAVVNLEGMLSTGTVVMPVGVRLDAAEIRAVDHVLSKDPNVPDGWAVDGAVATGPLFVVGLGVGVLMTAEKARAVGESLVRGAAEWDEKFGAAVAAGVPVEVEGNGAPPQVEHVGDNVPSLPPFVRRDDDFVP